MAKKTEHQSKRSGTKMRNVDLLADEVFPWWKKTFVYVRKKEVATWKGALVLMFVTGIAVALIWGIRMDMYTSSDAAAESTIYFDPASTTVNAGSGFILNAVINPGTNAVNMAKIDVAYDQTKFSLASASCSLTFPVALSEPAITEAQNGTASIYCGVSSKDSSVTSVSTVATFYFNATSPVANSTIAFAPTTAASADGETGNVIAVKTGATVTVNAASATSASGGSITYVDGYYTSASVAITADDGKSETGTNAESRILQRRNAILFDGICTTFGSWENITPTGTYPNFNDKNVESGNCYQYQYLVSDNAMPAKQTIYTAQAVAKIDTAAPEGASITYPSGYLNSSTVALTADDGSDDSGISTASRIIRRRLAKLSGGNCEEAFGDWALIPTLTGTYPNFFDNTAESGNCYQYQIIISDNATNQAKYSATSLTAKIDADAPTGGIIEYSNASSSVPSVSITIKGNVTDVSSGINPDSRILQRSLATGAGGICGNFGPWETIVPAGTYPNFIDAQVTAGNCYQYRYLVYDNAGNQAMLSSADIVEFR